MNRRRLLRRLSEGAFQNVKFTDARSLIEAFGFNLVRARGSHRIFAREDVPELLNLQDTHGEAKPYQLRQFLKLVERYNLQLEDDS